MIRSYACCEHCSFHTDRDRVHAWPCPFCPAGEGGSVEVPTPREMSSLDLPRIGP